ASTGHYVASPTFAYFTATVYSISQFFKAGTASSIQLTPPGSVCSANTYANFSSSGAGSSVAGADASNVFIQAYQNGWYRVGFTFTTTGGAVTFATSGVFITTINDTRFPTNTSAATIITTGAQAEQAATVSSFIITAGSNVTRTADVATVTLGGNRRSAVITYTGGTATVSNPTSPLNIGASSGGA
ncbi:hypothetical protein OY671_009907, partial [Metschnikowia pulcherrima]